MAPVIIKNTKNKGKDGEMTMITEPVSGADQSLCQEQMEAMSMTLELYDMRIPMAVRARTAMTRAVSSGPPLE
jgi:hypothetical protein